MSLLKLDYCGKIFSRGNTMIHAVHPTVMEFGEGVHVIFGPDGAGKSTLMHMMAGMEPPSDGKVYYNGTSVYDDLDLPSLYRTDFAFIFPEDNLVPEFNVGDNLRMPLRFQKKKEQALFDELTEALELKEMLRMRPQSLSEYELQRASIARSLLQRPKILFADEPTMHLNTKERGLLMARLLELCQKHEVTLILTADHEELLCPEQHTYFMQDGELTLRHEPGREQ